MPLREPRGGKATGRCCARSRRIHEPVVTGRWRGRDGGGGGRLGPGSSTICRRAEFSGATVPRVTADLRIDADVVQPASVEQEVGRLLHPQISEFFLFDGELLRDFYDRLNTSRERDLLRESIDQVLGIPALQLAKADVGVLTDDVLQRQTRALRSATEASSARKSLLELKSKQESLDKDKDEIAVALRKARAALEDVKDRIASVEDLKADAREMEVLEASIASGGQQEDRLRADMRNILTNGWLSPVAQRLRHALDQVVSDNDTAQHRQNEMLNARSRVNMLREQVAGGHCPTCHQALPPADEATVLALKRAEGDSSTRQGGSGRTGPASGAPHSGTHRRSDRFGISSKAGRAKFRAQHAVRPRPSIGRD